VIGTALGLVVGGALLLVVGFALGVGEREELLEQERNEIFRAGFLHGIRHERHAPREHPLEGPELTVTDGGAR